MKILVVGSGGREHALCWAIAASPLCDELQCAPGNGGIASVATCIDIAADDIDALVAHCQSQAVDFVVIGPEQPLVMGLADRLDDAGIGVFGPSAAAAQLEGSKGFTKDLCQKYGIPAADYGRFDNAADAKAYVLEQGTPIVVKADGLAAGKGVIMAETDDEAMVAIDEIFGGLFGQAGTEVVIEEWMQGEEISFFALCDGENTLALASAQDHKRVGDGDTGPNTGGMGSYSPAPIMTDELADTVMNDIILPTVAAMKTEGTPYKGVLYAGLMITDTGPRLFEYNARFGDPECQVLMMRLKSDILPALIACNEGGLDHFDLRWHDTAAMTVVMATEGYPGSYEKGSVISNLEGASADENVEIFHAGTSVEGDTIIATGGRVLNVTGTGANVAEARANAYRAVEAVDWPQGFYRSDIGWRALKN
ncbi:MAG: phosphoribosylamine--glycine ligase [Alphaproteobacteria bacterium]|nr:MAG: phosphoribosylamine--glycine ligase [Alphaproteobacteria bacterium]